MKTLQTLGADIKLVVISEDPEVKKVRYWFDVTHKGEKREGWFSASDSASDEVLGLMTLNEAGFEDDAIVSASVALFEKALAESDNKERDMTRLMFSL
jgi:hypothetical protein